MLRVTPHTFQPFMWPVLAAWALAACEPGDEPTKDVVGIEDIAGDATSLEDIAETTGGPVAMAPSIHGTHFFQVGDASFAARDLTIQLKSPSGTVAAEATSNAFGDWLIPAGLKPGTYRICSSAAALAEHCQPEALDVPPATTSAGVRTRQVKAPNLIHPVTGDAVTGHVSLADGSRCLWHFPIHGVEVDGAVSASFEGVTYKTRVNHTGAFLLPLPLAARGKLVSLAGACGSSTASVPVQTGEGVVMADVTIPGKAPRPIAIELRQEGKAVRALRWGASYDVKLRFADDTPVAEVSWAASIGTIKVTGDATKWTLTGPIAAGDEAPVALPGDIEALVGDGKGAFALLSVTFPADLPVTPVGTVNGSDGAPLVGAVITHRDKKTVTDDSGVFKLPEDSWNSNHPLRVSAPGYLDRVVYASSAPRGAQIELTPCESVNFEAKVAGTIRLPSDPEAFSVSVPPGVAKLADGEVFGGTISACMAFLKAGIEDSWTLGTMLDAPLEGGAAGVFTPMDGFWIDFRDAADPTRRVSFTKPVSATLRTSAGAENLAVWTPERESFHDDGPRTPEGGVIRTELSGTTALTPMTPQPAQCIRLYLDGLRQRGDFVIRYRVVEPGVTHRWQFQLVIAGVERLGPLPANRTVEVQTVDMRVSSPNGGDVSDWRRTVTTGPDPRRNLLTNNAFAFDGCGSELVLPPYNGWTGSPALSRYLPSLGSLSTADFNAHLTAYVGATGFPQMTRNALYTALDMDAAPGMGWTAMAVYLNAFDLGFNRRVLQKTSQTPTGARTAYVVENSGWMPGALDANGTPNNAVAIIATPPTLGADPVVVFRVIPGSPSGLATYANLDGLGLKPVPYVCQHCHGGDYLGPTVTPWPTNADIGARFLPFAPETLEFPAPWELALLPAADAALFTEAAQEPRIRALNEAMLATGIGPAARRMIHGHYGSNDPSGGTLPPNNYDRMWVPPGNDTTGWSTRPDLYRTVVGPYCRACHLSLDHLDFATSQKFTQLASAIEQAVCGDRSMPHAMLTSIRFWGSLNPYIPAILGREMAGVPGWRGTLCPQ